MLPICLRAARTHNLRSVDLELPAGQFVALTGPSGSGKSSLAIDTLYAEGQRRFVESFSPYARQFLERLQRPDVDRLDPIAATVAVDRRAPVKSSRSTLATLADLEPYLSALFAAEAVPQCPRCGVSAVELSATEVASRLLAQADGSRAIVSYPLRVGDEADAATARAVLLKDGFRRVLVGEEPRDLEELAPGVLTSQRIAVVVDRVTVASGERARLVDALEQCLARGGSAEVQLQPPGSLAADAVRAPRLRFARGLYCPSCARSFEAPHARLFSYNSPLGACPACRGFGRVIGIDWDKVIPDPEKSLREGAIRAWSGKISQWERAALIRFAARKGIPMDKPWRTLTEAQRELVLTGEGSWDEGKYPGVRAWFSFLEARTYKMHVRVLLSRYRAYTLCSECQGARLAPAALAYKVAGLDLSQWHAQSVAAALDRVDGLGPRSVKGRLCQDALGSRLRYLEQVGLGYLTLDRQARTLSGGEAQRAGLTTALGAALTGTLFILDEPSVGLHACDVPRLGAAMQALSRAGNTVLLVEHDESLVHKCDRVVELGPGAGHSGGQILYDGSPQGLSRRPDLPTGRAWQRRRDEALLRTPRRAKQTLALRGVRTNNLQDLDVEVPLGVLVAVTGPSGSGKSTLVEDVLYRAVARLTGDTTGERPAEFAELRGADALRRAVLVDQSPLGRTARGNPATYTKAWDRLRARLAAEPEAQKRGLLPSYFSFNVAAGRCEACDGEGYETVEMQFLADVSFLCPVCQGQRFKPEVLAVTHCGLSVAQILTLTVSEALERLSPAAQPDPALRRALLPVVRVGLGYLPLGQPLSTLSGGEAQRLKLARALGESAAGTLFVVDEPSAGLHAEDVRPVVAALHDLVDEGASVVVVEHDLDVIAAADWVIDLGPGGGPHGGQLVAQGTPAQLTKAPTKTGEALRSRLLALSAAEAPATVAGPPAEPAVAAITVDHAREHNLKEVSCQVPHGALTVVTGPSGSGKSSLAFDVVYAEGQRRFMETLSPYARQFLPTLPRPDVDHVAGVPPAIALEQRTSRAGANSTVATVTEVAHYLRLLFAKVGTPYCPRCDIPVVATSADALFAALTSERGRFTVYAPAVRARKGVYLDLLNDAARAGITEARIDGKLVPIDPPPKLAKTREHTIDLVVYCGAPAKLTRELLDRALGFGDGGVRVARGTPTEQPTIDERVLSTRRACARCGTGVPELDTRWFSFNTKQGQCESCEGRGFEPAEDDADAEELPLGERTPCRACGGTRLSPIARKVRLCGLTYPEVARHEVSRALELLAGLRFEGKEQLIAKAPRAELLRRLEFVQQVGLGYLALDRAAATLSGGEMQRLRLSAQLGSGLTGALYVLDEPTIGLHPRDTDKLIRNLRALVDTGSTVLVIEHDEATIRAADHLIDLGPGGGRLGGRVVAEGPAAAVLQSPDSPTAQALAVESPPAAARAPAMLQLALRGASAHNLKGVDFRVPVGRLCVVAGVSGSGKSTLVQKVFYPALRRALGLVAPPPLPFKKLDGVANVKRALAVDQSPIGRTPRSVPATFLGVWDEIRRLYASLPESKLRGYTAQRFSFNTPSGGRCPTCQGQGAIVSEMSFLPDVVTACEACGGARFEPATLEVTYSGRHIGEILHLSADEAVAHFQNHPRITRPLQTLRDLGVGYLQLGQGSNTLSGGEAQRLKLAAELTARAAHEPTVYVLDEPTTGLHLSDVRRLISVLARLVDRGDTLVVIEHQPDVIAAADWVVELGPEAGAAGGEIVFTGTPAQLLGAATATGQALRARRREDREPGGRSSRTPERAQGAPHST